MCIGFPSWYLFGSSVCRFLLMLSCLQLTNCPTQACTQGRCHTLKWTHVSISQGQACLNRTYMNYFTGWRNYKPSKNIHYNEDKNVVVFELVPTHSRRMTFSDFYTIPITRYFPPFKGKKRRNLISFFLFHTIKRRIWSTCKQ